MPIFVQCDALIVDLVNGVYQLVRMLTLLQGVILIFLRCLVARGTCRDTVDSNILCCFHFA